MKPTDRGVSFSNITPKLGSVYKLVSLCSSMGSISTTGVYFKFKLFIQNNLSLSSKHHSLVRCTNRGLQCDRGEEVQVPQATSPSVNALSLNLSQGV